MNPHYYLMKNKKILRLESDMTFNGLPLTIQERVFDVNDILALDQEQANWRVVIFRDEIMDLQEYSEWLLTAEPLLDSEIELDLIAN